MKPLGVLDLFSGIGGFSLGLERTNGFVTEAFCEVDPFCRRVLAKHWPEVPIYDDVRSLTAGRLAADGLPRPDVVCGGFPCQDISVAGLGAGLAGERSGLWSEMLRIVAEARPRWVLIENVALLRSSGLHTIMVALDALGYMGEWHCIPASAVGAPHQRDRLWVVAHAAGRGGQGEQGVVDPEGALVGAVAGAGDRASVRLPAQGVPGCFGADAAGQGILRGGIGERPERSPWPPEPALHRMALGVPNRLDRCKRLGNAVVPKVVEVIGRAILEAEGGR